MSKFIWIAQFTTTKPTEKEKKSFGMIILDATETSKNYIDALLFIVYPDRYHFFNKDGKIVTEYVTIPNFDIYSNFKN